MVSFQRIISFCTKLWAHKLLPWLCHACGHRYRYRYSFFYSQIIGKFCFLHAENATEFVPEMESILLENGAVIVNDCTNRGTCQWDPGSALVNFTKWSKKYYSLRLKTVDKASSQSTLLVRVWKLSFSLPHQMADKNGLYTAANYVQALPFISSSYHFAKYLNR